jgi:Transcription-silencing protein Clr2
VPWERVLNGEFGPGDAEVDGSILAGKEINDSYTLFTPLGRKTANPGDVFYAGMFLGAEKIWVGEAVRLQAANNDIVVMVIEAIIEDNTVTAKTALRTTVIGDIYAFVQMHLPPIYNDRKNWPTPRLPARMAADLQWRNENSFDRRRNIWSEWQLKEPRAKRGLSAIKGRWYETRRLLPILRPDEFEKEVSEGETYDAGVWMNSRFDAINDTLTLKQTRLDAFGRAAPKDLKISLGLDESPGDGILPDQKSNIQFGNAPAKDGQYGSRGVEAEEVRAHSMDVDTPTGHQDFYSNTMQH